MVKFFSSWVKTLGLAIVIVSILEMLLPNNKTKKYIRMVMGIYILFTIISPFISNKEIFNFDNFDLNDYVSEQTSTTVNQTSMKERIQELYIQELEKDITKKLEEKGYKVNECTVKAKISDKVEETEISKIKVKVEKSEEKAEKTEEDLENKIVARSPKNKASRYVNTR